MFGKFFIDPRRISIAEYSRYLPQQLLLIVTWVFANRPQEIQVFNLTFQPIIITKIKIKTIKHAISFLYLYNGHLIFYTHAFRSTEFTYRGTYTIWFLSKFLRYPCWHGRCFYIFLHVIEYNIILYIDFYELGHHYFEKYIRTYFLKRNYTVSSIL